MSLGTVCANIQIALARRVGALALLIWSWYGVIAPIHGSCSPGTYEGGVSVRFCDSLSVGMPNRLIIRAYSCEEIDTAVLLLQLPDVGGGVRREGVVLWSGQVRPFEIIVAEYPVAAMTFGDYRYVATLKFIGRTWGHLQVGGALSARLAADRNRWIEGDHWEIDVLEINELIEKAGMTGQPYDSILKSLPDVRKRVERFRRGGAP